eukprot:TRINITY_DN2063_c0_g1_i3.p1 TRINITY_DN2063_c0_g1~~TRINITY_DN2063_c0_g1_i3.p1  ORF type:complete len:442 (-),score=133.15 TRINITY_DN2063_c0_g1_i3:56-1339(-)
MSGFGFNLMRSCNKASYFKKPQCLVNTKPIGFAPKRTFAAKATPGPSTVLSEEEEMLRSSVRKFAETVIKPKVREMDERQEIDPAVLKACFEQGLMGIEIPTTYGGTGMTFTSACITIEELARVDPAVSVIVDVQNTLIANAFLRWGTEEQKQKYLSALAANTLGSFCLTEWGSGSDAFALQTTAEKKGDYYILNGTKAWITNSKEAGLYLVMANADPVKKHRGITTFVVEKGTPGLSVGKKEDKLGIRASSTCEVLLQDCKVHQKDILGTLGSGYKIAIETLNEGRIGIGAQMLGLAQGAYDSCMPYIVQRKQFGQSIAQFQGMQFQFAEMALDIYAARNLVYNAARLKDAGEPFITEASMAKLFASRVAERVSSKAIELMGGVGFSKDFGVEKFYRDSKIGQIYEGTSNIQLQTIAKDILKQFDK